MFLSLSDPEMAIARVATRVRQGGHDVPEVTIRRRFAAGRRNFETIYREIADSWMLYDATGPIPVLISQGVGP